MIFIFSTVLIAVITVGANLYTASNKQGALLSGEDQARKLVFQMVNELRNSKAGSDGSYQLELASDQQLIFHVNTDGGSDVERVNYYLQNAKLYKGTTKYSGGTYNTSTQTSLVVQSDLISTSTPIFYYYDGNYTGSSTQSSLAQPVNVTQVKFVKVNLQIANKAGVKNQNFYTVSGGGAIRSLKTNLGQ